MPSIEAAVRARRVERRRRLLVGLAALTVGTLLVGLGAAGAVGSAASLKTGALVGGVVAVGGLLALLLRTPMGEREAAVAAVGAVVGLASLLFFWLLVPADGLSKPGPTTVAAALGYCFGLAIVLASFLAAASSAATRRRPTADASGVSWTRRRSRNDRREATADGGSADDELAFPLDDE